MLSRAPKNEPAEIRTPDIQHLRWLVYQQIKLMNSKRERLAAL